MNQTNACVECVLPAAHGTISTVTPQRPQLTRRMLYTKNTAMPHSGTKVNRRGGPSTS
jgi:hypothetical protein